MEESHQLRVLIANQRRDRLEIFAKVVTGLGHEVIAREIHVSEVAAVTARERPDMALVGLGRSDKHALELISEIVKGAFCPVIALLESYDGEWLTEAAERGVYAYVVDTRQEELQTAIEISLRRFSEVQQAQGAFARRDAEALKASERLQQQQRQLLELHDGVVQSLTAAQLSLELELPENAQLAVLDGLEAARTIVSHSLDDLEKQGVPLAELIRDMASSR